MNCKICGNSLRTGKKYCSLACRNESYKKIRIFNCKQCKKEVKGTARKIEKNRKFCSQACVNEWKKEAYKGRKIEYIQIECNYCGSSLERMPSKVNKKNYCNKVCKGKHVWKTKNLSQKMVYKPCCGMIEDKKTRFRSRWELVFAKDFLEKNKLNWSYEPLSFQLSDGSRYTPDFYIKDDDVYVEIKGYDKSNSVERFFKFRKEYPEINTIFANKYVLKNIYKLNLSHKYLNSLCVTEGQDS